MTEGFETLLGRTGIRFGGIAGGELGLGEVAHSGEGIMELVGAHAGLEQFMQLGGAMGARDVEILTPRAAAHVGILLVLQLGETGSHTGFHRPFPNQVGAEGVNGSDEEPFEMREGVFDACLLANQAVAAGAATKPVIGVVRATEARNMLLDAAPDRMVLVARSY